MMNGSDIISILRSNIILQRESLGYIETGASEEAQELVKRIKGMGFIVVSKRVKPVLLFDYVVLLGTWNCESLLYAFGAISKGGIIVVEAGKAWDERYVSRFGEFTATRVSYGDRYYVVIKGGMDYGN